MNDWLKLNAPPAVVWVATPIEPCPTPDVSVPSPPTLLSAELPPPTSIVTPDPEAVYVEPIHSAVLYTAPVCKFTLDVIRCVISANAGLENPINIIIGIILFIRILLILIYVCNFSSVTMSTNTWVLNVVVCHEIGINT